MDKPRLALILGSGFSHEAQLPTTSTVVERFLNIPTTTFADSEVDRCISKILSEFWEDVFGYCNGDCRPSLEDHFTVLDLAANSGHHLGAKYNPKRLRAIRRMSIHRIFGILEETYVQSDEILRLLRVLLNHFDLKVINLNWDIVLEKHLMSLDVLCNYEIDVHGFDCKLLNREKSVPILKMHGSSNWVYCDSCRKIFAELSEKSAYYRKTYLETEDFNLLECPVEIDNGTTGDRKCCNCTNTLAGRIATFSYRKAFSIAQFQTIWDRAHVMLSESDKWLFVGYSMPQADFEFLHLLKSAQLGRKDPKSWFAEVVIHGSPDTRKRYKSFFGLSDEQIKDGDLKEWVKSSIDKFIEDHAR